MAASTLLGWTRNVQRRLVARQGKMLIVKGSLLIRQGNKVTLAPQELALQLRTGQLPFGKCRQRPRLSGLHLGA